ncbi:MAG: patatin-like phospholipase family protein [Candidatus Gottesmanbacteria bacterium]
MKKRKMVGLALGSGGVRGLVHIGVIKTLLAHQIPIDMIAGTSAGSVIGGVFAALGDINKVEAIVEAFGYRDLAWILTDAAFSSGVIKGQRAIEFLAHYIGKRTIESLSLPFAAVATNVASGEPVIIKHGDLINAVRASSSVPLLFQPMKIDNSYLMDGGISLPVPASVVRGMGADIVIAVNCDAYLVNKESNQPQKQPSSISVAWSTINSLRYSLAKENSKYADIIIEPRVTPKNITESVHGGPTIQLGIDETEKKIDAIKRLLALK